MYSSLHCHTEASNLKLLDCIVRPKDLINKAIEMGLGGVAITDHEIIANHVDVLELRDKIRKDNPNFKIALGIESYLIKPEDYKVTSVFPHFLMIAKDKIGHDQIRHISSRAWDRAYFSKGQWRVPTFYSDLEEIVAPNKGHLIASSACLGSALDRAILARDSDFINWYLPWLKRTFGANNCYIELQPADTDAAKIVNPILIALSKHFGIKYIITTDVHYLNKEDRSVHEAFISSRDESDREVGDFYAYTYLMTEEEIYDLMEKSGVTREQTSLGLTNTLEITAQVEDYDIKANTEVPQIVIPEFTPTYALAPYFAQYPFIEKFAHSEFEADRYLYYLIETSPQLKLIGTTPEVLSRLNTEFEILWGISDALGQRLSSYELLTRDILDLAWNVSFVGPGRGSSGGFLINYLLGITQFNPLQYGLVEWRFLNLSRIQKDEQGHVKGGGELPDIDSDFNNVKIDEIIELMRQHYGANKVLKTLTIKTMTLKSAIINSCRGLGNISNDEAQALAALVPAVRGIQYTFEQCLNGDEERELPAVPNFEVALKSYPRLFETVQQLEGLWCGRGQHASSVYVFSGEEGYLEHNSLLRAPNGTPMTMFNMKASDKLGALKEDLLVTDAMSKIQKCVQLMLEGGAMEWQGSLRATYNKYLHPDVLNQTDKAMWEKMANGEVISLFQFGDSKVGRECIKKIRPTSISELGLVNDTMRLQSPNTEQPIDTLFRYKNDPSEWEKDAKNAGVTNEEIEILRPLLKKTHYMCTQQETLMLVLMDPHISCFTLAEANHARKILAKKIMKEVAGLEELYFKKCADNKVSKPFADFVWESCIKVQLAYSFCSIHSHAYSLIALQEANLACFYDPMYWACAVLTVTAGGDTDVDMQEAFGDEEEETVSDEEVESESSGKRAVATTNYGKIAKAIGDLKGYGYQVDLPDINRAHLEFFPDIENHSIVYGLLAITNVNTELAQKIVQNRPYTSVQDFWTKIQPTNVQMISLIKAGCFDKLYASRHVAMRTFLRFLAEQKYTKKDKITTANLEKAISFKIIPQEYELAIRTFAFKKWCEANQLKVETKMMELSDEDGITFFQNYLQDDMKTKDYNVMPDGVIQIKQSTFNKVITAKLSQLMEWLNSDEGRTKYYEGEIATFIDDIWEKYCEGTVSTWEMNSLHYYYHDHELAKMSSSAYNLVNFNSLPEDLQPVGKRVNKQGKEFDVYKIENIVGTVIDTDNNKHIVTILTPHGVVDVKFYKGAFIHYNKNISKLNDKGKKTVIEKSWFVRGNKVMISGVRRDSFFIPKQDWTKGGHTVRLIESLGPNGIATFKNERERV